MLECGQTTSLCHQRMMSQMMKCGLITSVIINPFWPTSKSEGNAIDILLALQNLSVVSLSFILQMLFQLWHYPPKQ